MKNFIEQQITTVEEEISYLQSETLEGDWSRTTNVLEAVEKSLQALKAHMIQEFESRVPEEKPLYKNATNPKDKEVFDTNFDFNECRSIILEEINKLKNE